MGRDGVLPRRFFGYLNRRFETPVFNIVLIAVITLIAIGLDLSQATSLINFGAFMAFTVVNMCVILHFFRQRRTGELNVLRGVWCCPPAGPWSMSICCFIWPRWPRSSAWCGSRSEWCISQS